MIFQKSRQESTNWVQVPGFVNKSFTEGLNENLKKLFFLFLWISSILRIAKIHLPRPQLDSNSVGCQKVSSSPTLPKLGYPGYRIPYTHTDIQNIDSVSHFYKKKIYRNFKHFQNFFEHFFEPLSAYPLSMRKYFFKGFYTFGVNFL